MNGNSLHRYSDGFNDTSKSVASLMKIPENIPFSGKDYCMADLHFNKVRLDQKRKCVVTRM